MVHQAAEEWLFEVEDVFNLSGLGFIVVGSLQQSGAILHVGETLTFLCPDGQEVVTQIKSFPMISPRKSKDLIAFELPKSEETKHITAGSQVFRDAASS